MTCARCAGVNGSEENPGVHACSWHEKAGLWAVGLSHAMIKVALAPPPLERAGAGS